jgi:hypothetical protein
MSSRPWKIGAGVLGVVAASAFFGEYGDTGEPLELVAGLAGILVVTLALAYAPTLYRAYGSRRVCKPSEWTPYLSTDVASAGQGGGDVHVNTQAVHAAFDRMQYALPDYVSAMPAIAAGAAVASVVAYVGVDFALKDKAAQERIEAQGQKVLDLSREFQAGNKTLEEVRAALDGAPFLQARVTDAAALTALVGNVADTGGQLVRQKWILFLVGTLLASLFVLDKVQERVYAVLLLQKCKNRQHFAVAQFLKMYRDALR